MKTLLALALLLALAPAAFAQCNVSATLSCPISVVGASLSTGDCAAYDGTKFDRWQFAGTSGQAVTLEMSATAFDALLILIDPAGKPVAQNDDASTTTTDSRLTYTLDVTGTWTVLALSLGTTGTGSYALTADLGCPATATGPRRRSVRR